VRRHGRYEFLRVRQRSAFQVLSAAILDSDMNEHAPANARCPTTAQASAVDAWRVRRQDDNGNVFDVADGLTRDAAERLAAVLAATGHKQLYWVER